ncbi:lactonase family protein [Halalkalibaculum sp. DA3122]|uniref:lactonase family protein n=1 Tax=Halalkalibaculum sp. DA3122 TaxID=3373607 RepID=UPI0037540EB5
MRAARVVFLIIFSSLFVLNCSQQQEASEAQEFYLFVGTYTGEGSEGIYLYRFNSSEGSVSPLIETARVENPSYLAISPDHTNLYAVNEMGGAAPDSISSFYFDKETGDLRLINKQSSEGGGPCYVSVDRTGKAVFAGNYSGGSLAMLPVREDGGLREAKAAIQHTGSSVNESRQQRPHVHCTYISPDNRRLFVNDLGTDQVVGYAFDDEQVVLEETPSSVYEADPGAGPRHLTFHPSGEYAYLVNELNGTVVAFEYTDDGRLETRQTLSTLPEEYEGAISGADIHVSPDGKYLYVSNREDLNNIVIYAIDQGDGTLRKAGSHSSGGVHPRNFVIDPTGAFLLVANRHTDNIVVFRRNRETGLITPTGTELEVSQPVCLKMIPVQ